MKKRKKEETKIRSKPININDFSEKGKVFRRWTVLYTFYDFQSHRKYKFAKVKCICGNEKLVLYKNLLSGDSSSCGCWNNEVLHQIDHGMSYTRTYKIWHGMLGRCENKHNTKYKDYGGRNICVCNAWHDFKKFFLDMGECPKNYSIDRINTNGNYEPSNCRWVDWKTQCRNKRNTVQINYLDKIWTLPELAEFFGFSNGKILYNRIFSRQWSIEEAVTIPLGKRRFSYAR